MANYDRPFSPPADMTQIKKHQRVGIGICRRVATEKYCQRWSGPPTHLLAVRPMAALRYAFGIGRVTQLGLKSQAGRSFLETPGNYYLWKLLKMTDSA
jgi:hypothetical protein